MNSKKLDIENTYLRYSDICTYLNYLGDRYNSFVSILNIGKTCEGRQIKAIKIDLTNTKLNPSNWIVIEAGTHAREWITVSSALYVIKELTECHNRYLELLTKFKFLIIPLVNADGYEYSHTRNKRWRKNRRPIPEAATFGVDCNRNYDIDWENGVSKATKNTYKGDKPFSEAETVAIRNIMHKLRGNLKFYLALHSCAQNIMYPWGYTNVLPAQWKKLNEVAKAGSDAIYESTGGVYRFGSISHVSKKLYTGSVCDYAFSQNVPYPIVMELPSPKLGFHPPKEFISALISECWIGIKAMCYQVARNLEVDEDLIGIRDSIQKTAKDEKLDSLEIKKLKQSLRNLKNDIKGRNFYNVYKNYDIE